MVDVHLFEQLTSEASDDGVQQLVVGAVIHHDSRVLLLRRPEDDFMGGIYELPSGKVEDEAVDDALRREVKEETGLDVVSIRYYLGHFDYMGGGGKRSRQFNFAVDVATPEPVELQEHDAYVWSPLHEEPPVTGAVKDVLTRYRELRGV
ncbi:MAG TPA: NUDIX domain-containing protein [Mycobacteriales bacterium]|nr:NUDIX domain-containing protein [Mycobacteriales bacterium]